MWKQRKSQAWRRFGYPVLISTDFDNFTSPFTLKFLFRLRSIINIKHEEQRFIGISKHQEESWKYEVQQSIFDKI